MLLNISSLDFWESWNMVSVEACFVFKHYFCLYTPNVDLVSVVVASSLFPGHVHFWRAILDMQLGKDALTNGYIQMAVKYDPCGRQEGSLRESG